MQRSYPLRSRFWIYTIFVFGLVYLGLLQKMVPEGIHYTGDSGLKAMVTQSLAGGHLGFDLNLPASPWIRNLWEQGLFPYQQPFVYEIDGRYFTQYPYPFLLVNAPFYAAFGDRGLYIVPILATVITWVVFCWLGKKLRLHPVAIAVGLFFLIFASNLSLYSATYWEHTLSVCMGFSGLALIVPGGDSQPFRNRSIAWAGVLTGLAVWFRPEQIFLVIFLAVLSLWPLVGAALGRRMIRMHGSGKIASAIGQRGWIFLSAALLTLLCYGLTNWLIYNHFFGVHAIQVLKPEPMLTRLLTFADNLRQMTAGSYSLFLFLPVSLFVLVSLVLLLAFGEREWYEPDWTPWYLFCLFFIVGVSALVPTEAGGKQWGPRFLLLLVPVITLLFTWQIDRFWKNRHSTSRLLFPVVTGLLLLAGIFGIVQNPILGWRSLANTYQQVNEVVEDLRLAKEEVIVVSNPYLTQVFQPPLGQAAFFLKASRTPDLALVSHALVKQQQNSFLFICYSFECDLLDPEVQDRDVELNPGVVFHLHTNSIRVYGKYTVSNITAWRNR